MAVERPPAPASQALVAYAIHHPGRRQYIAATGFHRVTGVLAQARLYPTWEEAERCRVNYAPGDTMKEALKWGVVAVACDLQPIKVMEQRP